MERIRAMPNKFAAIILKRIRARREEPESAQGGSSTASRVDPVSLREAQFSDFERVSAMNLSLGQGADSLENWHRLWRDNPALAGGRTPRIGWMLEAGGNVVGFLGSIPLECSFEGKTLTAVATCRLAVEPAYRSSTHLLVTSFFRQKDVEIFLNTTATVAAGKIMTALRAVQLPQREYGEVLFWVLRPRRFANIVLQKAGVTPGLARIGGFAGGLALGGDVFFRRRSPRAGKRALSVKEMGVEELGPEFDAFWRSREGSDARIFAKRSREILRWHFEPPGTKRVARMLACNGPNGLAGYAVVRHEGADAGMRRTLLVDLMVESDNAEIVDLLVAAAHRSAKRAGSDVFEVVGLPKKIRDGLRRWRPYSRQFPACPYFFKTKDRALQEKLAVEDAWYAGPFDGDATLWP
jgi:hypothetical protein